MSFLPIKLFSGRFSSVLILLLCLSMLRAFKFISHAESECCYVPVNSSAVPWEFVCCNCFNCTLFIIYWMQFQVFTCMNVSDSTWELMSSNPATTYAFGISNEVFNLFITHYIQYWKHCFSIPLLSASLEFW